MLHYRRKPHCFPAFLFTYPPSRFLLPHHKDTSFLCVSVHAVDAFHFQGHTEKWCRENCNPKENPPLPAGINGSASEQRFSQLSKFAHILRYTGKDTHKFLLLFFTDMLQKQLVAQDAEESLKLAKAAADNGSVGEEIEVVDAYAEELEDDVDLPEADVE